MDFLEELSCTLLAKKKGCCLGYMAQGSCRYGTTITRVLYRSVVATQSRDHALAEAAGTKHYVTRAKHRRSDVASPWTAA